jgi:glycolate oxidase iron-sulfur subunit
MHAHSGYLDHSRKSAQELMAAMPDDLPVIVNSAGCGSTMKEYGHLLPGSAVAEQFAKRTLDASEFLMSQGLADLLKRSAGVERTVTYHDACHLAHGQKVTRQPRELLKAVPNLLLAPLPESEMCCGSAGVYNVLQPQMARKLLERKMQNIESTGAGIVVTGNPGCHAWIAQASRERGQRVHVLHTMELLEAAFSGIGPFLK